MTTMLELLHLVRDSLAAAPKILFWAQQSYGRDHAVYLGLDQANPPDETGYPALHVTPVSRDGSMTPGEDSYRVSILCGVHEDGAAVAVPGTDQAVELPGVTRLEELVALVVEALDGIAAGDIFLAGISVEYETVEFYPYYLADVSALYERPREPGLYM